MANGDGKFWKVISALAVLLGGAAVLGGINMYGDVRVAKANDASAKETNDKQDISISENTAMAAVAASIARTVDALRLDQKAFMHKMDIYIQKDIERDARDHHTHSGRNP
jgi:hypothetical protein